MTLTYGFYNSISNDRVYDASQISSIFDGIIKDGVFMSIGAALVVTPGTDLSVEVGEGRAWFNHTWTYNDSIMVLNIDTPDLVYPRIDVVVLEIDSSDPVRANSIKIIKGTPGAVPVVPTLSNTLTLHQYPLAHILVNVGAVAFTAADITNKVGTAACPFVSGILGTITLDSIITQWQSQFENWFDNIKDQLSTDAAGNLQLQINAALKVVARQGYIDPDAGWNTGGSTNYLNPENVKIQVGDQYLYGSQGLVTVVFPIPFSKPPIVFANQDGGIAGMHVTGRVVNVTTSGCQILCMNHITTPPYHQLAPQVSTTMNWIAIGPID
jgi:hypothetical protein